MNINTDQCPPAQMRKNLVMVDELKSVGVDFVPIPCLCADDRRVLERMLLSRLSNITIAAELKEQEDGPKSDRVCSKCMWEDGSIICQACNIPERQHYQPPLDTKTEETK